MELKETEYSFRNCWYYLEHHPKVKDEFKWWAIAYAPGEKHCLGSHWVRTKRDAKTWAERLIKSYHLGVDHYYDGQPGEVPLIPKHPNHLSTK